MKYLGYLFVSCLFFSCGKKQTPAEYFELNQNLIGQVVNDHTNVEKNEKRMDRVIYNDEKGIHFTLFKDQKISYELIGLGKGDGEWRLSESAIIIEADTGLFKMFIEIIEKSQNKLFFQYRDRFGPQLVEVSIRNEVN